MEFSELVKRRYSVRSYNGKKVEQEKVEKILEAAHAEEMGLGRKLTDKLKSHRIEYVTDILSCTEKELRETVVLNDREMSLLREKMREFQLDFWDELF